MVRKSSFANVVAWCEVSNPAWCRIETLFRCCVFGKGTSLSNTSLDSGVNEDLVRWRCNAGYKYIAPKRLQDCMLAVGLKWHMDEQVEWSGEKGGGVKSAAESSNLTSDY